MHDKAKTTFGEALKKAREAAGLSQRELCEEVDRIGGAKYSLKQGTLSAWESGRQFPRNIGETVIPIIDKVLNQEKALLALYLDNAGMDGVTDQWRIVSGIFKSLAELNPSQEQLILLAQVADEKGGWMIPVILKRLIKLKGAGTLVNNYEGLVVLSEL